ncbi:hypothetical protein ACHWQZ_G008518 [Mnemiopsis leidyi]
MVQTVIAFITAFSLGLHASARSIEDAPVIAKDRHALPNDLVDFESLNTMDTIVHHSNEEEGMLGPVMWRVDVK